MTAPAGTFIRRHTLTLRENGVVRSARVLKRVEPVKGSPARDYNQVTTLVINASTEMAREMTFELSRALPGCAVLFAPTLNLALWILKRRKIDLIVTSSMFPDGRISRLTEYLDALEEKPELVVVGDLHASKADLDRSLGYHFVELRRLGQRDGAENDLDEVDDALRNLGADIRNDLNNPLQEIVAMAFVAQAHSEVSPLANDALGAIERAAKNMASIVNSLEDKIRNVVEETGPFVRTRRSV